MGAFLEHLMENPPQRVAGTAVYMFGTPGMAPPALLYNVRANHVLHEHILCVSVVTDRVPRVHPVERVVREDLGHGLHRHRAALRLHGEPNVGRDLRDHCGVDNRETTYFLGKETVVVTERPGMAMWREHLFAFIRRNATSAAAYFHLPTDRVIEISTQVEL